MMLRQQYQELGQSEYDFMIEILTRKKEGNVGMCDLREHKMIAEKTLLELGILC